jgi:hypothetical protein
MQKGVNLGLFVFFRRKFQSSWNNFLVVHFVTKVRLYFLKSTLKTALLFVLLGTLPQANNFFTHFWNFNITMTTFQGYSGYSHSKYFFP